VVLLSTVIAPAKNGNGNGHGKKHTSGLARIARRWSGVGNGNGNGNGNGHGIGNGNGHGNGNGNGNVNGNGLELGYEPFVSVQIASYNEKRVIERLLEACSRFEYPNYEVILVDDSTDESSEILARWQR